MEVVGPETLLLLFGCALGIGCIDAISTPTMDKG
jgi:hypothetical protein